MNIIRGLPFVDAQAKRERHPETFYAPVYEDLQALKPGNFVQLCLDDERFWVEIVNIEGSILTGRIDNDLLRTRRCKADDRVEFCRHHIYKILTR